MKRSLFLFLLMSFVSLQGQAQMRGYPFAPRVHSWRIGLEAGVGVLGSDLTKESHDYHFRPMANLEIAYVFHRNAAIGAFGGAGMMRSTQDAFESNTDFIQGGLLLELRIPLLRGTTFPILQLRGGAFSMRPDLRIGRNLYEFTPSTHLFYGGAAGVEVISWRRLGIRALFGVTYTSTDKWDMVIRGDDRDGYSWMMLSLHYYFQIRR
ncbi:MAG: hypothetical protein JXA28_07985 [Bacteroidetes bacterium]|nr:hypothetical protein [Bacteroidota bacterium]